MLVSQHAGNHNVVGIVTCRYYDTLGIMTYRYHGVLGIAMCWYRDMPAS